MIAIARMIACDHSLVWKLLITLGHPTKNRMATTTSQ